MPHCRWLLKFVSENTSLLANWAREFYGLRTAAREATERREVRQWGNEDVGIWNNAGKQGILMTSSKRNLFHVTGPLLGKVTGHRWIPFTKISDAELWCFFLISSWTNVWVNNRYAIDLRRHRTQYDVTLMIWSRLITVISHTRHGSPKWQSFGFLWVTSSDWQQRWR